MRCTFLMILSTILVQASFSQPSPGMPEINYEKLVSRASLDYHKPAERSEEGMPIGNGRMGSLIWTTSSAIRLQLNRVDVFGNNSASNNFYERHTDYCGGVGQVEVDFLNNEVFTGTEFSQHLSVYDALATVRGDGVSAQVIVWHERDVMAMRVNDSRGPSSMVHINLRAIRLPVARRGNHEALSRLLVRGNRIILTQEFKEDEYYCASSVAIEVAGADAIASSVNETTVRLSVPAGQPSFSVMMASSASFDPAEDIVAASLHKLETARGHGFDGMYQSNKSWWKEFWQRSFVQLHSADGKAAVIEKNYTYYLYVMAASSRGAYPPKFNGMLWTTGGDDRKWGNLYWGANQSCLYNALLPVNRMELMDPMFNMYSSMRDVCAVAAQQQWASKGIFIPETVAFDGLAPLPDDIAAEMRDLYLLRKHWDLRSKEFSDYAQTKMPFLSRWNWKKDVGWKEGRWIIDDKGAGPFGHVSHIFSRGAKIAYQYWLRYEYTQDKVWLEKEAYPMLKGVAEFYRNFPNLKKEVDGKYHIYHVNDNESVWGGHNTIEELSSMMGIFPVAISASELLDVDANLRKLWKEISDNLSILPLSANDHAGPPSDKITWVRSLKPVVHGDGSRLPDPNTLPVWFFDLCTLESSPAVLAKANATFDAYFKTGIDSTTNVNVLSKLAVAGSLLGRAASTRYLVSNQIATAETEVMRNRMDLREGFQTTSVQRLGRAAEALNYALCQSVPSRPGGDPVIHVFPAWPAEWDAQFKLSCRGGFLVSGFHQNGIIEGVQIESRAGVVCRIRNPWPERGVTIYRNEQRWRTLKGSMLVFSTKKDDQFILLPN